MREKDAAEVTKRVFREREVAKASKNTGNPDQTRIELKFKISLRIKFLNNKSKNQLMKTKSIGDSPKLQKFPKTTVPTRPLANRQQKTANLQQKNKKLKQSK